MIAQNIGQRIKQEPGLKILVVDDDSLNQRLLSIVLSRDDHIITFAHDGHEAINKMNEEKFDLIFMDIHIPGMDGIEVCRYIRDHKSPNRLSPIVALTASSTEHKKLQELLSEGLISDLIYKPFEKKHIERIVETIQAEKKASFTSISQKAPVNPNDAPVLETQNILPLFSNSPEKYKQLFDEFLQTLPERIEKMKECEETEDWKSLSMLAHNLTGVAANFGALKLSALAYQLDKDAGEKKMPKIHGFIEDIEKNVTPLQQAFSLAVKEFNELKTN